MPKRLPHSEPAGNPTDLNKPGTALVVIRASHAGRRAEKSVEKFERLRARASRCGSISAGGCGPPHLASTITRAAPHGGSASWRLPMLRRATAKAGKLARPNKVITHQRASCAVQPGRSGGASAHPRRGAAHSRQHRQLLWARSWGVHLQPDSAGPSMLPGPRSSGGR